ncbi:MAG: hypothetical protein ACD_65C00094G0003 [uncultured bacterium]|nr:MAG: hypothetical protein ACD_65C00094G0003 [uncultured bacterium]KKT02440.1 MAG: hypothetical protein UV80_C0003G0026 [Candidatus Peregrinibacteria bacterium GW2011_GWF2_43_17]HAU40162.1 hypothetical protein [Candidatus Peregrinibacteria bacterium]
MFSGFGLKFFNLDGTSTHHIINEIAYKHALKKTKKNGFPGIISLDLHSGYYGPDGKWSKPISKVSDHMYNPATDSGNAMNNAIQSYKIACKQLNSTDKLEKKLGNLACARGLHFLVDGLTPAHHIGHKVLLAKSGADWNDPYWNRPKSNTYNVLFMPHGQFEKKCAFYMFLHTKKIRRNYAKLRQSRSPISIANENDLENFLKKQALKIRLTGIYEKFLSHQNIKDEVIKELFPEMIYTVEIYIRSLYASAALPQKQHKYRGKIARTYHEITAKIPKIKIRILK